MKIIKSYQRIIHCIAQCNCGWTNENYRQAARAATIHARQNPGHEVHVERGVNYSVRCV
jgi:hypothetical protein